jgi:hypothetical protein
MEVDGGEGSTSLKMVAEFMFCIFYTIGFLKK